ncbi:MAG: acyl-CoA dehydrogenase family protein [Steroidobacteraceae bacterium]
MDLNDSADEAAFRSEVRAWLAANAPAYRWGPGTSGEDRLRLGRGWMAAKANAGYMGIALAKELGGRGGTPLQDLIFREEEARVMMGSHDESFGGGLVGMAIPTILGHAQPGWAEKLIAPTLRGDILWCQLFSEPGGGSDMAAFRTRAVRNGNEWIVNGQKIWTSGAHNADWGLLLARSDPSLPKHQGLTYFLVNMKSPGIEVRPLKQISERADFNEVFFTDVRIPDDQRLGEVNGGWNVAITTMMNERLTLLGDPSVGRDVLAHLIRIGARTAGASGTKLVDETAFREKIASYYVAIAGTQHIRARIRTALGKGIVPGPEATIGKMTTSRWLQEMAIYSMDAIGPAAEAIGAPDEDLTEIQDAYFLAIGFRIGGGTEEIGKNIIAERILGLPQDPRPDKLVPFSESSSWGVKS